MNTIAPFQAGQLQARVFENKNKKKKKEEKEKIKSELFFVVVFAETQILGPHQRQGSQLPDNQGFHQGV